MLVKAASRCQPLKHIAQLLGPSAHSLVPRAKNKIPNEIYVIVCLTACQPASQLGASRLHTFAWDRSPILFAHIFALCECVCVCPVCCNILFIALAIKCTLGAFVTISQPYTMEKPEPAPVPYISRPSPKPFPLFARSFLSQVKILQHHA